MTLYSRILLSTGLLAATLVAQFAMWRHLSAPGPLPSVELERALSEFPMQLGEWRGSEHPAEEGENLYGDEYIQRDYYHPGRRQMVALWLTYSRHGEDRGHHPEVCMVVAGKREDTSVRQTCPVGDDGEPVQQYRFAGPLGDRQWVFYWHYTLPPEQPDDLTSLQLLYQRMRRRPSSVTIEVFAPEHRNDDVEFAREFVGLVDATLAEYVGHRAERGNERLPVTVVEPDRVPTPE